MVCVAAHPSLWTPQSTCGIAGNTWPSAGNRCVRTVSCYYWQVGVLIARTTGSSPPRAKDSCIFDEMGHITFNVYPPSSQTRASTSADRTLQPQELSFSRHPRTSMPLPSAFAIPDKSLVHRAQSGFLTTHNFATPVLPAIHLRAQKPSQLYGSLFQAYPGPLGPPDWHTGRVSRPCTCKVTSLLECHKVLDQFILSPTCGNAQQHVTCLAISIPV